MKSKGFKVLVAVLIAAIIVLAGLLVLKNVQEQQGLVGTAKTDQQDGAAGDVIVVPAESVTISGVEGE
ncbi:hypothetical protein [Arabiibacter massiliensis]|uniref:hypothetical protein n=1 Tax=Arabiibacter massiliensis TaxID=1870985 RepID=UPI0009B9B8F0|nr:hypothetical protein [Arabiibacter massiliensis]